MIQIILVLFFKRKEKISPKEYRKMKQNRAHSLQENNYLVNK